MLRLDSHPENRDSYVSPPGHVCSEEDLIRWLKVIVEQQPLNIYVEEASLQSMKELESIFEAQGVKVQVLPIDGKTAHATFFLEGLPRSSRSH